MPDKDGNPTLEELLAGGPPTGGSQLPPIGVPQYLHDPATGASVPFTANGQDPKYFEGDEWVPASAPPGDIARLQRMMVEAGIIQKGAAYRVGIWDPTTRDAYKLVLAQSNATALTPQMVIQSWAQSKPEMHAAPYLKPDIASIKQDVKSVIKDRLGREVTEGELPALINEAFSLDRAGYDASVSNALSDTAGVQVDPAARFKEFIDSRYKPEIDRNREVVDLSQNRERLLGSIFSLDQQIAGT